MRVAIIGAGILGASTAFHLAQAGAEVVVADRADPGRATEAGAGIVAPWLSTATDEHWYRIAAAGARAYPALVAALAERGEPDPGHDIVGALAVDRNPTQLRALADLVHARAAPESGDVTPLSPAEARRLFPPLHPFLSALHVSGGARVEVRRFAAALLRASGAQTLHAEAVPLVASNQVQGIRVGTDRIAADAVVVTAGAWAPALLAPFGLSLRVEPQRGQIVHLHLPNADTAAWPVILPPGSHYMLAFEAGRIVAGATREPGVGFDHRVTAGGLAEILSQALSIAPGLADAEVLETRVGFRPLSPDARPMLGAVPGISGLFLGDGLGPNGITIGPYAGRLLAQLALAQTPEMDLAPYAPFRDFVTTDESALLR
jgi:D-amino-acid dehydrogenase